MELREMTIKELNDRLEELNQKWDEEHMRAYNEMADHGSYYFQEDRQADLESVYQQITAVESELAIRRTIADIIMKNP
jgi:hypothetical protein